MEFGVGDHARLAEALRTVAGKWLLTYNDVPEVRELYAGWAEVRPVSGQYSISAAGPVQRSKELLISNY